MKLFLVIFLALTTVACTTPVKRNFPEVPEELRKVCPGLEQVDPKTTQLSEVVRVVTDNYAQYHECKVKVDSWIEWYNTQKAIFDSVK